MFLIITEFKMLSQDNPLFSPYTSYLNGNMHALFVVQPANACWSDDLFTVVALTLLAHRIILSN